MMRDQVARDRLLIKLFYTACCAWTGLFALPLALITDRPDSWDPSAANVASIFVITVFVLLPIWTPLFRRRSSGLPRSPLEFLRVAYALLTPLAAALILWFSLMFPIAFLFDSTGSARLLAALAALAAAALFILLTWTVATSRDLPVDEDASLEP